MIKLPSLKQEIQAIFDEMVALFLILSNQIVLVLSVKLLKEQNDKISCSFLVELKKRCDDLIRNNLYQPNLSCMVWNIVFIRWKAFFRLHWEKVEIGWSFCSYLLLIIYNRAAFFNNFCVLNLFHFHICKREILLVVAVKKLLLK